MIELIERLHHEQYLSTEEFTALIANHGEREQRHAAGLARAVAQQTFSNQVYIRGLIEFTNYCRNDCIYCGIRRSNGKAERYRLDQKTILECCAVGYDLGFRTFVLQGGEDAWYANRPLEEVVAAIRSRYPDCAITLSVGEKSESDYRRLFEAGANRYLLRHETADPEHYRQLHPASLSLENRTRCLYTLKKIGFQTGTGFMVGSPFQEARHLAADLSFIHGLQPQMVGIGPFIPHRDTPFAGHPPGSVDRTLFLISLLRLMLPKALLPATTALGTLDPRGREKGILSGANVVMPNLSPLNVREKYLLYNDKLATGMEAAEHLAGLSQQMADIGYRLALGDRGDFQ